MNIYIGNIGYNVSEEELEQAFKEFGEVTSVKIIKDQYSGKSKGFGFIDMPNDDEANRAIEELNDTKLGERALIVNPARPKDESNRKSFRPRKRRDE
jgi:RNA recognition motif-containing protein